MAKIKALPIALAIASALTAASASAVEFHGYARAGLSTTGDGGEQTCYGSGAGGHWTGRLGDECDTYVELDLAQEVYNRDGKVFRVEAMWATDIQNQGNDYQAVYSDNDTNADGTANSGARQRGEPWGGGDFALRQIFASGKGVLGFAPEATIWAGKRFYQRKDVHWLDLFYVNNSGYGAGVEGIKAGPGQLSFAWTNFDTPSRIEGDGNNNQVGEGLGTIQNNKLDIRYSGIPLWAGANLELIGIYGFADLTDAQDDADYGDDDGYFVTAEISHGLMGGFNKIVVQYGKDSMGHAAWANHGGGESLNRPWWDGQQETSYRFMDFGVIKLSADIEMGYSVIYQVAETYGDYDDLKKLSIVARPTYKWNDVMSTAVEIGYSDDEGYPWEGDNGDYDQTKLIVSQNWSAGKSFWARPQIRVYAGSFWGDQAEARDDDGNLRFGAQVEAWW
ncbi:maltoporin LamB [Corallincola holothuriorum]|uniref:Maltoporin LamB n=1 Tax=Corallincola holothuriorum TaxID=2282215 RepID=A0A368NHJ7_9GAMM|nr:maltoporin LamB [Corallincola holothuriorum]RCU48861.1 maltoporin LamB [Corallincola holothuriorum]